MAEHSIRAILNEAAARLAHLAPGRRDAQLLLQRALGRDRGCATSCSRPGPRAPLKAS